MYFTVLVRSILNLAPILQTVCRQPCGAPPTDSLRFDGIDGRVIQQVVHKVVVDLNVGNKDGIAVVLLDTLLNPRGLWDSQDVPEVGHLRPEVGGVRGKSDLSQ